MAAGELCTRIKHAATTRHDELVCSDRAVSWTSITVSDHAAMIYYSELTIQYGHLTCTEHIATETLILRS